MAISSASPSPNGDILPEIDPDTITAMPAITAIMAPQVLTDTLSPKNVHASSAAINGPPACISRIFATVVCDSAMMNAVEAVAKQSVTPKPAAPMPLSNTKVPRRPSRKSMKRSRNPAANRDRQKTTVQPSSTFRLRAIAPPKLHTTAEEATRKMPRPNSTEGSRADMAMICRLPFRFELIRAKRSGIYTRRRFRRIMACRTFKTLPVSQPTLKESECKPSGE